jgi:nitrogen-specific signal transduction histidine kinase
MKLRAVGTAKQWSAKEHSNATPKVTFLEGRITPPRSIPIVCADALLSERYSNELRQTCVPRHVPLMRTAAEARTYLANEESPVILFDESAAETLGQDSMESVIAMLAKLAPVVVVASAKHQEGLAFLITSGVVDFVPREADFVSIAARLIERRIQFATSGQDLPSCSDEVSSDNFGEILRHELNNPLTGILGNAELLLAKSGRLPNDMAARVEVIAELAVRLRETVRRLSNAWMSHHD